MTTRSPAELIDWLGSNLFLAPEQLDLMRPLAGAFADESALAKDLIERGWLTPYQANQILQGHGNFLIVGPNRLLNRIGEGAMGQVFRAWNTRLGRVVAVKMIHKEHLDKDKAMERFKREIRTSARLEHPNIALVRDADEADGRPFLVMDYIEGEDLARRVKIQGPLPIAQAVEFARQTALGLQHAYERGVIHRDIKPGNLFVTRGSDNAPLIKILDLGLARFDSDTRSMQRMTQAGNVIGTVDYVAPEQTLDAHTADIRADIYSLGCSLFYMLTAKPPFAGNSVVEKVTARREGMPPSVRVLRPEVPVGLDAVMQKMMAREPDDRYQTPKEAAQALAPFARLGDEAPTVTLPQRDLQAALARPMAHALVPMAEPAGSQDGPAVALAHAVPVTGPSSGFTAAVAHAAAAEAFHFHDSGVALAAAADAPAPERARPAPRGGPPPPPKRGVWLGVGVVAVLSAVATFWAVAPGGRGKRAQLDTGAHLQVLPCEPVEFKDGGRKPVIIRIQRTNLRGEVKVRFENLPDGISAGEATIPRDKDTAEIALTVSYDPQRGSMKLDLKLVAVAENLQTYGTVPVVVVASRKPRSGR